MIDSTISGTNRIDQELLHSTWSGEQQLQFIGYIKLT